jgi:NaMN:DMB phosphoribosyltransferase
MLTTNPDATISHNVTRWTIAIGSTATGRALKLACWVASVMGKGPNRVNRALTMFYRVKPYRAVSTRWRELSRRFRT